MRIVQIIDSLEAGGAERMAVNYANVLAKNIDFSSLIATRKEGSLKGIINHNVNYLFLNKKRTLDFIALHKLKKYCKKNKIDFVHVHGTSFFIGFLLKIIAPNLKIVWHEHYGNRVKQDILQYFPLYFSSYFFSVIFVVNHELEQWAKKNLLTKKVFYIRNFPIFENKSPQITLLNGIDRKRIVCLANFKEPKNHPFLLKIASEIKLIHPDWTFHLVGKVFNDAYSNRIFKDIEQFGLAKNVFVYDSKNDIENILNQSTIAILTSQSEGLPVSFLEYGLAKKAVVATNVGEINAIIQNNQNGFLVESDDVNGFTDSIIKLINDANLRERFGLNLNKLILIKYEQSIVLSEYLNLLKKIQ